MTQSRIVEKISLVFIVMLAVIIFSTAVLAGGSPWATGQVRIVSRSLTVSPANQEVPLNVGTTIQTTLLGAPDPIPSNWVVQGELSGPGFDPANPQSLTTVPNKAFIIPPLPVKGEYTLGNIKLVTGSGDEIIANPSSVTINVMDILLSSMSCRPMTDEEIKDAGIVLNTNDYKAFRYTVGLGVEGNKVYLDIPVLFSATDPTRPPIILSKIHLPGPPPLPNVLPQGGSGSPELADLGGLDLEPVDIKEKKGGGIFCDPPPSLNLAGMLVFPNTISYRNQFFVVGLMLQNGAPEGSELKLDSMEATLHLPNGSGLLLRATNPPGYLNDALPINGPNGETVLGAQMQGTGEFDISSVDPGDYKVTVEFDGTLLGLPDGQPVPIHGQASGMVIVRDPTFNITFAHPSVVHKNDEYHVKVTLTNTSTTATANQLSISMGSVSGADVVSGPTPSPPYSLKEGESTTVDFLMHAKVTGRVTTSSIRDDNGGTDSIVLTTGVGDGNIPLSPDTLILPQVADKELPSDVVEAALDFLGLGWGLATSDPELRPQYLTPVSEGQIRYRANELTTIARYLEIADQGEYTTEQAMAELALKWLGNDLANEGFDSLRRVAPEEEGAPSKGQALADALGSHLVANGQSIGEAHRAFADAVAGDNPSFSVALDPDGESILPAFYLEDSEQKILGDAGDGNGRIRDVPYGESYPFGSGRLLVVGHLDGTGGFTVHLDGKEQGTVNLSILAPFASGVRLVTFSDVPTSETSKAIIVYTPGTDEISLRNDTGSGGPQTINPFSIEAIETPPLEAIGAFYDQMADQTGRAVSVLFNRAVDKTTAETSTNYVLSTRPVTGAYLQPDGRIVEVRAKSRISPLNPGTIDVSGVKSKDGIDTVQSVTLDVKPPEVINPGGTVDGIVYGEDGAPLANAEVDLLEYDEDLLKNTSDALYAPNPVHITQQVTTDSEGRFNFDYVMLSGHTFEINAYENGTDHSAKLTSIINSSGQHLDVALFMRARGSVKGHVFNSDGTPAVSVLITVTETSTGEFQQTWTDFTGLYHVDQIPVGLVSIQAEENIGNATYSAQGSVRLSQAGDAATVDLQFSDRPTVSVTGKVVKVNADGSTSPVQGAIAALLYGDGTPLTSVYTADDGTFTLSGIDTETMGRDFTLVIYESGTLLEKASMEIQIDSTGLDVGTIKLYPDQEGKGTITGRLYQPDGITGVDGATVYIGAPGGGIIAQATTKTDENGPGSFTLTDVPIGDWSVNAYDPTTHTSTYGQATIAFDGQSVGLVLRLPGRGTVYVTVHDAYGNPANNVKVYLLDKIAVTGSESSGVAKFTDVRLFRDEKVVAIGGTAPNNYYASSMISLVSANQVLHVNLQLLGRGSLTVHVLKPTGDGNDDAYSNVAAMINVRTWEVDEKNLRLKPKYVTGYSTVEDGTVVFKNLLSTPVGVSADNGFDAPATGSVVVKPDDPDNPNDTTELTVYITPAGSIQGTVYAPDGITTVPYAPVTLKIRGLPDRIVYADQNGAYLHELVRQGSVSVEARDPQTSRVGTARGVVTGESPPLNLDVRLLGEGDIQGMVMEDNGSGELVPSPSARVTLKGDGIQPDIEATTDYLGQFSMKNVREGSYAIDAVSVNHEFPMAGRANVVIKNGATTDVSIKLGDFGVVTGTVTLPMDDGTNLPVDNAQVQLITSQGALLIGGATSDQQGRFSFEYVPAGKSFTLKAYDARTGRTGEASGSVSKDGTADFSLQLGAVATIKGQVLSHDGTDGISGAEVHTNIPTSGDLTVTADVDGNYTMPDMPQGSYHLWAKDPASGAIAQADDNVTIGSSDEGAVFQKDLYMPAFGGISGTVYDYDGTAVEGAYVSVGGHTRATGEGGVYTIHGVSVGKYTITAWDPASADMGVSDQVTVQDSQTTQNVDITFVGLGDVSGMVTDSSDRSVEGFQVRAVTTNPKTGKDSQGPIGVPSDGTFAFHGLRAGQLTLTASPPPGSGDSRSGSITLDFPAGSALQNQEITLSPARTVVGTVVDQASGEPVSGASVHLIAASPAGSWLTGTNTSGVFYFPYIPLDESDSNSLTISVSGPYGGYSVPLDVPLDLGDGSPYDVGEIILDSTPPKVTSVNPANEAVDVAVETPVTVVFSEEVRQGTVNSSNFELMKAGDASPTDASVTLGADGLTVTLTPASSLDGQATYTLTIHKNVLDDVGNPMSEDFTSTFKTVDNVPPAVESSDPLNGAVQITPDAVPSVIFTEDVDITDAVFTLTGQPDDSVEGNALIDPQNARRVIFERTDSSQSLIDNTAYTLSLTGVKDMAGNVMAPWQITFDTLDNISPVVSLSLPSGTIGPEEEVTIEASVTDNLAIDHVEFYADGTLIGTRSVPPYEVLYTTPSGAGGTVAVKVKAYDKGDNFAWAFGDLVWVSDATPPTIVISSPQNGQEVYSGDTLEMQAGVTDESGVASVEFRLEDSQGALLWSQEVDTAPYQASYPVSGITDEVNRSVVVRAVDVFGNEALSNPVTVTFVEAGRIHGQVFQSDGQTAEGGAQVVFSQNGGFSRTVDADNDGYYDSGALPVGIYSVVAHTSEGNDACMAKFPEVGPEATVECNLTLLGTGTVTGRVVDGDNGDASIPGAKVEFDSQSGVQQTIDVTTGDDGKFTLPYVLAGNYSIRVFYPDNGPLGGSVFGTMTPGGEDNYDAIRCYKDTAVVTEFSPADGSAEVDVSTPVTITFSQPVNPQTLSSGIDVEYSFLPYPDSSNPVTESWSLSGDGLTATMTSPGLAEQRVYHVFVRNVLSANNKPVIPAESRFSTRTPPQPVSLMVINRDTGDTVAVTTPPDETRNVPLRASIDVTFDQDIDPASVADSLIDLWTDHGVQITGTVQLQADGRTLEFVPGQDLATDSRYYMSLNDGLTDTQGDTWWWDIELTYLYTQDTRPPIAAILSPPDNALILDGADWLPVETISQDGDNYCGTLTTTLSVNGNEVSSSTKADCEPTRSELYNSIPTTGGQSMSLTESVIDAASHTATSTVTLNSVTIESGDPAVLSDYPGQMATLGDRAYLSMDGEEAIKIFDVDPVGLTAPQLRGSFTVQDYVECLVIDGKVLWMGLINGNLVGYDVSDPQTPMLLSTTFIGGCGTYCNIKSLAVSAGYAYVVGRDNTLHIYSLDDPSNPVEDWSYQFATGPAVQVENGLMLVNAGSQLFLYDVSDPSSPTLLNSHFESFVNYNGIRDAILEGGFLYIGYYQDNTSMMSVVDITNPSSPVMKYAAYVFDSYELDRVRYGDLLLGGSGYFDATNLPYGGQPSEAGALWSPRIDNIGSNSSGVTVVGENGIDSVLETLKLNVPMNGTSLSIDSPTDGSTVRAKSLIPVEVTPNAEFTGSVELYVNDTLIAQRDHKPYTFSYWLPSSATPGQNQLTLEATIVDDSGATIHSNVVTLNVEPPDTTPPEVVSTIPADNAIDVSTSVHPSAEFNEPLDPQSVTTGTVTLSNITEGYEASGEVSLSTDGKTITFQPEYSLQGQDEYTFSLGSSILDLSGNAFAGKEIHFTCLDDEPPTAYIIEPSAGSYVVGGDTSVRFGFADNNGVVSASLLVNGVEVASVDLSTVDGPGFIAIPPIAQPEGSAVTLQIQVADAAGNTGLSESVTVKALWDVSETSTNIPMGNIEWLYAFDANESRVTVGGDSFAELFDRMDLSAPIAESDCGAYKAIIHGDYAVASSDSTCPYVPASSGNSGGILTISGWDLAVNGGLAATLPIGTDYDISFYSLTDMANPRFISQFSTEGDISGVSWIDGLWLNGSQLMVWSEDGETEVEYLSAYDISDLSSPVFEKSFVQEIQYGFFMGRLFLAEDYEGVLSIYDLSMPSEMTKVGSIQADPDGWSDFYTIGNRFLCINDSGGELPDQIYDLTDPSSPALLYMASSGGILDSSWATLTAVSGSHRYAVSDTQDNGDGTYSADFSDVTIRSIESTPPTVSITYPADGSTIATASGLWTVKASISDDIDVASVDIYANNHLLFHGTQCPWAWYLPVPADLMGQSFTLEVRAVDLSGNETSATETLSFPTTTLIGTQNKQQTGGEKDSGGLQQQRELKHSNHGNVIDKRRVQNYLKRRSQPAASGDGITRETPVSLAGE